MTERLSHAFIALAIVAMVSGVVSTTGGLMTAAWADASSVPQLRMLPEGEITAVGSTTLDVAGRLFSLDPKLTIVSDEGQPMEFKQLRPGLVIQYHVKEGALDRIIVLLPR
jgi:ABC-type phosphate transport system substrate-binding protein